MKKHFLLPIAFSLLALTACGQPIGGSSSAAASSAQASSASASTVQLTVTYNLNYEGAAAPTTAIIDLGTVATEPASPSRTGYTFVNWCTDAEGFYPFEFEDAVTADVTLYACWNAEGQTKNRYAFEAEYAPCILTMQGSTYSGGTNGKGLIQEDYDHESGASGGFFVHFLYVKGNNLTFDLNAAQAGTAKIVMRLSAEYASQTLTIDDEIYKVKVNSAIIDYGEIVFNDVKRQGEGYRPFTDHLLTASIPVLAGANKIEMITDNEILLMGTASSTAPMVDCLKIETDSTLTWPGESKSNIILDE